MKVLFIHPNDYLMVGIPTGISILSAVLKKHNHKVDIFDMTFVKTEIQNKRKLHSNKGLYKPTKYSLEDLVKDDPIQSVEEAFKIYQEEK